MRRNIPYLKLSLKRKFCNGITVKMKGNRIFGVEIYFFVRFVIVYIVHGPYYENLLNFDVILERYLTITQANSQVCFCLLNED